MSTVSKKILLNLKKRYSDVEDLIAKTDARNLSKEEAKRRLLEMKGILEDLLQTSFEDGLKLTGMLAGVNLLLGKLSMDFLSDTNSALEYFMKCKSLIEKYENQWYLKLLHQEVLQKLGTLMKFRNPHESLACCIKAEEIYRNHKRFNAIEVRHMFGTESYDDSDRNLFRGTYIATLFTKSIVYEQLKDLKQSAICAHTSLELQLEDENLDYLYWAHYAARAGRSLVKLQCFTQARHHLAASQYAFEKYESCVEKNEERGSKHAPHMKSFLAWNWAFYSIELLLFSIVNSSKNVVGQELNDLVFKDLDILAYETQITDKIVVDPLKMQEILEQVEKWLEEAYKFPVETSSSMYCELRRCESFLFALYGYLEKDVEDKLNFHQMRVNRLEDLNKIIDDIDAEQRQFIWLGLGHGYCDIVNVKWDKCNGQLTPTIVQEINENIGKSIENYAKFINTTKNQETGHYPLHFLNNPELEKNYLQSLIQLIIMYKKFIRTSKNDLIRYYHKRWKAFFLVISYLDENSEALKVIHPTCLKTILEEMKLLLQKYKRLNTGKYRGG